MERATSNYTIFTAIWCWTIGHLNDQWQCLVDNSEAAQVCLVYCSVLLAVLNIIWTIEKLCWFLSRWRWRRNEAKKEAARLKAEDKKDD